MLERKNVNASETTTPAKKNGSAVNAISITSCQNTRVDQGGTVPPPNTGFAVVKISATSIAAANQREYFASWSGRSAWNFSALRNTYTPLAAIPNMASPTAMNVK